MTRVSHSGGNTENAPGFPETLASTPFLAHAVLTSSARFRWRVRSAITFPQPCETDGMTARHGTEGTCFQRLSYLPEVQIQWRPESPWQAVAPTPGYFLFLFSQHPTSLLPMLVKKKDIQNVQEEPECLTLRTFDRNPRDPSGLRHLLCLQPAPPRHELGFQQRQSCANDSQMW